MARTSVPPRPWAGGRAGRTPGPATAPERGRARRVRARASGAEFDRWAEAVAIDFPKGRLPVKAFEHGGAMLRGLAAPVPLQAGDRIMSVPRRATLETHAAQKRCPRRGLVTNAASWDALDWDARLATLLLHERSLGDKSPFAPYMQQLPWDDVPDLLPLWTDDELAALNDADLAGDAAKERARWSAQHAAVLGALREAAASTEEAGGLSPLAASPPTYERFADAMALVRSRAFSGPFEGSEFSERVRLVTLGWVLAAASYGVDPDNLGTAIGAAASVSLFVYLKDFLTRRQFEGRLLRYALCPAIDLLNRADDDDADFGDASSGGSIGGVAYGYFTDNFDVVASAAVPAGGEVTVSYGPRSDADLLMRYGFVPCGANPADWTRASLARPTPGFAAPSDPDPSTAVRVVARLRGGVDDAASHAASFGGSAGLRAALSSAADLAASSPSPPPTGRASRLALASRYRTRRAALLRSVSVPE